MKLSKDDFTELAESLANNFWIPTRKTSDEAKKQNEGFLKEKTSDKLTWTDIITMYLMEYYHGNYVDRYGAAYKSQSWTSE